MGNDISKGTAGLEAGLLMAALGWDADRKADVQQPGVDAAPFTMRSGILAQDVIILNWMTGLPRRW